MIDFSQSMQNGNESNLTDLEQKEQELANRCYQDVAYLQFFPLHNDVSVLNYFATSPFFQKTSNNQILISQRLEQPIYIASTVSQIVVINVEIRLTNVKTPDPISTCR